MLRKKFVRFCGVSVITAIILSISALGISKDVSWNKSGDNFVPNTGNLALALPSDGSVSNGYTRTYLAFTYTSGDATSIFADSYSNRHAGMDIKNVKRGSKDMMGAYSITTSLPNPKTDLEDNNSDGRDDEAEAVALGKIEAGLYSMNVTWIDYRTGASTDNGQFNVNAESSKKGVIDYNVVDWEGCVQMTYGKNKGQV